MFQSELLMNFISFSLQKFRRFYVIKLKGKSRS